LQACEFGQNNHDIAQFFPEIVNHLRIISVVLSCSGLFVDNRDYNPKDVVNILALSRSVVLSDESVVEAAFNSQAARIVVKSFDETNIESGHIGVFMYEDSVIISNYF
jgi:hypothetical protein